MTSSKRLSTTSMQSSTVMRAIRAPGGRRAARMLVTGPDILPTCPRHAQAHLLKINGLGQSSPPTSSTSVQECPQQAGVAAPLLRNPQPAGDEDRAHLADRGVEILVDDQVIELVVVRHLLARGGQAAGDHGVAVLAALAHALLQRG